jgi:hypothetical protein
LPLAGKDFAMKTTLLVTADHPDGWTLEDILTEIQNDIFRRSSKIIEDGRGEARKVLQNNIEILALLTACIEKAHDSTAILNSLGPHEEGKPRIGVL